MPVMDGFATTQAIRAGQAGDHFRRMPIIALTANALSEERDKCIAAGMDDFLTKPVQSDTLLTKLATYLQPLITDTYNKPRALFDRQGLEKQMSSLKAMIPKLLRVFLDTNADTPPRLLKALSQGDTADIRLIAHTLKGSSGQLQLLALRDAAQSLEKLCDANASNVELQRSVSQLLELLAGSIEELEPLASPASQ